MTSFVHNHKTHLLVLSLSTAAAMARFALVLGVAVLLFAPTSNAFAPSGIAGLRLKSSAAVSRRAATTTPKMSLDALQGAAQLLAVAQNVPFVDEVTGDPQGFTAPVNHFASVSALAPFALTAPFAPGACTARCAAILLQVESHTSSTLDSSRSLPREINWAAQPHSTRTLRHEQRLMRPTGVQRTHLQRVIMPQAKA